MPGVGPYAEGIPHRLGGTDPLDVARHASVERRHCRSVGVGTTRRSSPRRHESPIGGDVTTLEWQILSEAFFDGDLGVLEAAPVLHHFQQQNELRTLAEAHRHIPRW